MPRRRLHGRLAELIDRPRGPLADHFLQSGNEIADLRGVVRLGCLLEVLLERVDGFLVRLDTRVRITDVLERQGIDRLQLDRPLEDGCSISE